MHVLQIETILKAVEPQPEKSRPTAEQQEELLGRIYDLAILRVSSHLLADASPPPPPQEGSQQQRCSWTTMIYSASIMGVALGFADNIASEDLCVWGPLYWGIRGPETWLRSRFWGLASLCESLSVMPLACVAAGTSRDRARS